jgi:hypothetical protein
VSFAALRHPALFQSTIIAGVASLSITPYSRALNIAAFFGILALTIIEEGVNIV